MREQRALNDLMVSVRDALARLTGDVAALAARVSETREYAERMADRPVEAGAPATVEMPSDLSERLDALETAIGQLAASIPATAAPSEPAEAPDLTPLVHITVPEAIRGAVPAALRDVIPDAIRSALGEQLSKLSAPGGVSADEISAAVSASVGGLRDELSTALSTTRTELRDALTAAANELRETLGSSAGESRTAMTDAGNALRTSLDAKTDELQRMVNASVAEMRTSVATALEGLRARLDEVASGSLSVADVEPLIDRASTSATDGVEAVRKRAEELSAALRGVEERLGQRLGNVDGISAELKALRETMKGLTALPASFESAIGEGRESMQQAIDAVAAQIREDAGTAAERIRGEAGLVLEKTTSLADEAAARLSEASTLALGRIGEAGSTTIDRLTDAAAAVEREMEKVPRAVREIAKRMDEFQESMLAYLTARDLALEETRDRVLQELLDEYAAGLSQRQRTGLGTGLRRAFARRRDKRDAERFRTGTPDLPKMPAVRTEAVERAST
ncbi:MAG: hypothetical protein WAT66_15780, partial [Actinomycetota bacterium]